MSGSSGMSTSNRDCTSSSFFASDSVDTNEMDRPLVPNLGGGGGGQNKGRINQSLQQYVTGKRPIKRYLLNPQKKVMQGDKIATNKQEGCGGAGDLDTVCTARRK